VFHSKKENNIYITLIPIHKKSTVFRSICNAVALSPPSVLEQYWCPLKMHRATASEVGCGEEENCDGIENVGDELMTFMFWV
jgi:hypothetical protein